MHLFNVINLFKQKKIGKISGDTFPIYSIFKEEMLLFISLFQLVKSLDIHAIRPISHQLPFLLVSAKW